MELAKSLINRLTAPFKPQEFKDEYHENVERLIKEKQKCQKITTVEHPRKAPVIDLMGALKRSNNANAKPVSKDGKGTPAARKTNGRRKAA
jgi:DNA end-binding protein Ku